MKRSKLNLVIDGIAFVSFVFLTTTGVVLYGLLPAGNGISLESRPESSRTRY